LCHWIIIIVVVVVINISEDNKFLQSVSKQTHAPEVEDLITNKSMTTTDASKIILDTEYKQSCSCKKIN
jgi:hypothetical protein